MGLAGTAAQGAIPAARSAAKSRVIRVPGDASTVQGGVDAARPGDLVLVAAGTYHEAITIKTDRVVLRGLDRNGVILDGRDDLENGVLATGDGDVVENLTVRRFQVNGLLFTKAYGDDSDSTRNVQKVLVGYRASYVTAYNNGQYGIYAYFARNGRFDHDYTSGHPDSGVYIGQCRPCDALVTDVVAERNAVGYEGTNASGNVTITRSRWSHNRVGLTVNSQNMERLAPQSDVTIIGNTVTSNNELRSPATAEGAFGYGIAIAGGSRNTVIRNLVSGNTNVGVAVTDLNGFIPSGNRITANRVTGNGVDLAYFAEGGASWKAQGNCFEANTFTTSYPKAVERSMRCRASSGTVVSGLPRLAGQPGGIDYTEVAVPPSQPSMPGAATAAPAPADDPVTRIDLSRIAVPTA